MPRPAKPWWDKTKKQWACRHKGRYVSLGDGDFESAQLAFHRLKATAPRLVSECRLVGDVFENYLRFIVANKAPTTFAAYRNALKSFMIAIGDCDVADLTPAVVQGWLDDQPKVIPYKDKAGKPKTRLVHWTETTKHDNAAVVCMAFRWAKRMRLISDNPLSDFVKPPRRRREGILDAGQWQSLIARYNGPFVSVLRFCRLTGCRPQEVVRIEGKHIHGHTVRFATKDSKGKRRQRVIVLPDEAFALLAEQLAIYPSGPAFRNDNGLPWTKDSIRQRFRRFKAKTGLQFNLGMIRKTWETEALTKVPLAIVAELAGHDPATALRHYAHLHEKHAELRAAANAAVQPVSPNKSARGKRLVVRERDFGSG